MNGTGDVVLWKCFSKNWLLNPLMHYVRCLGGYIKPEEVHVQLINIDLTIYTAAQFDEKGL